MYICFCACATKRIEVGDFVQLKYVLAGTASMKYGGGEIAGCGFRLPPNC